MAASIGPRMPSVHTGGGATLEEIDAIELWGPGISGFAAALFLWPGWIRRLYDGTRGRLRAWFVLLLRTLLVMVAVYVAQEALVRWLVARGTPAQLRSAQHLVLLQNGLHRNLVELEGLDVDRARMSGPDGKAFLAVFPLLGSGLGERVEADFGPALRGEVTRKLVVSAMGAPTNACGTTSTCTAPWRRCTSPSTRPARRSRPRPAGSGSSTGRSCGGAA